MRRLLLAVVLTALRVPAFAQETVAISEFVAVNDAGITDEDGTLSDWLELHNYGAAAIDLDGWYLTDNAAALTKWRIPAVTLLPGEHLLVWASDKKRAIPGLPLHTNFKLSSGGEYLGLVKPDGVTALSQYAPTFGAQISNVSYGHAYAGGVFQPGVRRFFLVPTPGAPNSESALDLGPVIVGLTHAPAQPTDADPIVVSATVLPGNNPVATVDLAYRVGYGSEATIALYDDGAHGDGAANDHVYAGAIPAESSVAGDMVRWRLLATDTQSNPSRSPIFADPTNSAEYLGTVIADGVVSALPVLRWFVQDPAAANTDVGTRASLFYLGRLYDNVEVHIKGQSSRGWPKKSYKFDFNSGDFFLYDAAKPRVEEMNVTSTYGDKSYLRMPLAWETYRDAGNAYSDSFPLHVRQNGQFFSVAIFVEEPDERYLERNGLDPDGALYKMNNAGQNATGAEKKTRESESNADLVAFLNGIKPGAARETYLFDNMNLPATINYLAATVLFHDNDHVGKNYFLYRDSDHSLEWRMLPWDKDLTFGRNYVTNQGVLNDTIWADDDPYSHPLFGDSDHPKVDGPWNRVIDALYETPRIRQMVLRRLRTLMDGILQAPGSDPLTLRYENRIGELRELIRADVALDRARWGSPWGQDQSLDVATDIIKNDFLGPRRLHLFGTHTASGLIPPAQAAGTPLQVGVVDASPVSGDDDQEYIELRNPAATAVDVSGFSVSGRVGHSFEPGTVIPAGESIYLSPKVQEFRTRGEGPRAGQALFAQGDYSGRLAGECGPLQVDDGLGNVVARACACAPIVDAVGANPGCAGSPVTLSGPAGAYGYTWTTGETTESITVSPIATADYGLSVVDVDACPSVMARYTRTIIPNLSAVTIASSGATRVCATCTGGTVSITAETQGGAILGRQWGYRTVASGPITPLAGEQGGSYAVKAASFPGAGDYRLVVTSTPTCGAPRTSNEVVISVNPSVSVSDASVTEGNSGTPMLNFTVNLSGPSSLTVRVNYATAAGTAASGSDYTGKSGTLTYTAGQTSKTVSVAVLPDTRYEPTETMFLNLTTPVNTTIADNQGVGTIVNDDGVPAVSIADASITEGNSSTRTITFNITLAPASNEAITVNYGTFNGSAVAPTDYTAKTGSVTFSAGQTAKTATVSVRGDTSCEGSETFSLRVTSISAGTATALRDGTGTIVNDDCN